MKNHWKRIYWLLLLVLVFTASVLVSVGVAHARYINVVTAPAVVRNPDAGVTSNCLISANEPPRTVMLGQLDYEDSIMVPFWLKSSGKDELQRLDWGVTNAKYADYLDISVFAGYEQLKADEKLELLEDIQLDLVLRVAPTNKAQTTPHEDLRINVNVTWGEELWGTFQVILPAVAEPETEPPTEVETEPATEAETEPATEPATEAETEPATEAETEPATEAETEPATEAETEPATEAETESATEAETEPATQADTEPATEADTEPATEAYTEPATEAGTEVADTEPVTVVTTESTEDQNNVEIQMNLIKLKALPGMNPAIGQLPVMIELDENVTSIRLGIQLVYGDLEVFVPFPNYTMFSLDGGASYYMLYGERVPEFAVRGVTSIPLLLDFSYAELDDVLTVVETDGEEQEKLTLAMDAYTGSKLRKHCVADVSPVAMELGQAAVKTTTKEKAALSGNDSDAEYPGLVLTQDDMLEVFFPVEWKDAEIDYTVEFLTLTEDQTLEYVPVTMNKESLYVTYHIDETAHKLVVRLGQKFVQPGTYRITTTWHYEEVCYANTQTIFFANYSAKPDEGLSSKEVPNDE